ncbi:hypothetical protein AHF37_09154 [Paragonimus kellicotti]|nr:hypothetical protein AHF37_09154 [Paragonimus kellicotti]
MLALMLGLEQSSWKVRLSMINIICRIAMEFVVDLMVIVYRKELIDSAVN